VVTLFAGSFAGTDAVSDCVGNVDRSLMKAIGKDPSDYYVNVHSMPDFANGRCAASGSSSRTQLLARALERGPLVFVGHTDRCRSGDLRETAGPHVVDETSHLVRLGDEGTFPDPLDGVADVIFQVRK
jgi:hypothetical protein